MYLIPKIILNNNVNSISIFFPSYNEEANIAESVNKADLVLTRLGLDYEIIVVNDGSKDKTREIVEEICLKNRKVSIVNHETNLGYGAAVWSGIISSTKNYIFFTDADLQFNLNELDRLLPYVPAYDAVIGYRIKRRDSFLRLLNAWGWNMLNRILFGLKVKDIDCAFKLFKREIFDKIKVYSRGAMISAEMLVRINRSGYKVIEVGVNHYPRTTGSPTGAKPNVIIRAFLELIQTYRGELGNPIIKQIIKFGIIGILNSLVDWSAYFILSTTIIFGEVLLSKTISYSIGIINSYFLNKLWTFKSSGNIYIELPKFLFSNLAGLIVNVLLMHICVNLFQISEIIGLIFSTIGSFLINFILSKNFVFNRD